MKLILLNILYAIVSIGIGYNTSIDQKDGKSLSPIISQEMENQQIPGIAISVIQDGKIVYSEGFGTANIELNTRVYPDRTRFRIASISKSLTSALLSRMCQNGSLNPDSSVYCYVSDYPKKLYDYTVKQVGGHTAGIRTYQGNEFYSDSAYSSIEDAISVFKNDPLTFKPGTQYMYSSYGWNLLSYVAEKVSNSEFLTLMTDSLFKPFGMDHTIANRTLKYNDSLRTGYYHEVEGIVNPEPHVDLSNKWAGGGFESTSEDVAWFGYKYWFGDYISDSIRSVFTEPHNLPGGRCTNYGIGWSSGTDKHNRKFYGHVGSGIGGKSILLIYPEHKTVIVVLSNKTAADLSPIYSQLTQYYLPE